MYFNSKMINITRFVTVFVCPLFYIYRGHSRNTPFILLKHHLKKYTVVFQNSQWVGMTSDRSSPPQQPSLFPTLSTYTNRQIMINTRWSMPINTIVPTCMACICNRTDVVNCRLDNVPLLLDRPSRPSASSVQCNEEIPIQSNCCTMLSQYHVTVQKPVTPWPLGIVGMHASDATCHPWCRQVLILIVSLNYYLCHDDLLVVLILITYEAIRAAALVWCTRRWSSWWCCILIKFIVVVYFNKWIAIFSVI